jgi:hypothetical protein
MTESAMGVDEFLKSQEASGSEFLAVIEGVADKADIVTVTPWAESSGCACHLAIQVRKIDIESLVPTGEVHHCCDKRLRVAMIRFRKDASVSLAAVFSQLAKSMPVSSPAAVDDYVGHSHDDDSQPHYKQLPGPGKFDRCVAQYERCLDTCTLAPSNLAARQCRCLCRTSLYRCMGGRGHLC